MSVYIDVNTPTENSILRKHNVFRINSFKNVNISEKTIVMCDIDETLLTFHPHDWLSIYDNNIKKYEPQVAYEKTNAEWSDIVNNNAPVMTDRSGFFDMIKRINQTGSLLLFVTARHFMYKDLAFKHFKDIGIEGYKYLIHFCNNKSKGDYIIRNIKTRGFKKMVFIDDLTDNLIDVKTKIPFCECYSFKFIPSLDNLIDIKL